MEPARSITAALLPGVVSARPIASSPAAAQEAAAVIDDRVFRSADLNGDSRGALGLA